jgi:hypothetical protein
MSPNQIRDIIKRNEEKNDVIVDKKKLPSLSSKAYKMFSQGQRSLPYPPSGYPDLSSEYRNEQKNSKEKEEICEVYEGDIAD